MSKVEEWNALVWRVVNRSKDVFEKADIHVSERGTKDPKVIALALLARSVNNCEAALHLIKNGFIVEGRTLVRCCWENLFWIAALAKTGDAFVKKMEMDDAFSRRKRGKRLLNWSRSQEAPRDFESKLEDFLADYAEQNPKATGIQHAQAAEAGSLKGAYIIYGELSGDAAHPSAVSLSRHVEWNEDESNFTIIARAPVETDEVEQTLEFACSSMLGIGLAANQIVGFPIHFSSEVADFEALSNRRKP